MTLTNVFMFHWLRTRAYLITTILSLLLLTGCGTSPTNLPQDEASYSTTLNQDQSTRVAIADLLAVAERTTIGRQLQKEHSTHI
jgi:starvation-inducible outer membrane lipoprotein